jgi:hypothetical protein
MDWGNLESGLVGAIAGSILGSAVTYLGAAILQDRESKQKQRAAVRALLAELVQNYQSLRDYPKHGGPPGGYSEQTWQSQLPLIVQGLTWEELRMASAAYLVAGGPLTRPNRIWDDTAGGMQLRKQLSEASGLFQDAADVIGEKVLTPAERKSLLESLYPSQIRGENL